MNITLPWKIETLHISLANLLSCTSHTHLIKSPLELDVGQPDGSTHALSVQKTQGPLLEGRRGRGGEGRGGEGGKEEGKFN